VLRDLLGLTVGEFLPLRRDERVSLLAAEVADGRPAGGPAAHGTVWSEEIELHGAEAVYRYGDGPAPGGPAVTRNRLEDGTVWYVSTGPDPATLREILRAAAADAGVGFDTRTPDTLETVERRAADGTRFLFLINHGEQAAPVPVPGLDLLSGERCGAGASVPAGGVRVLRLEP
jgi:beta-galactosidase